MLYAVLPKSVHYHWNACWLSIFGRKKVYVRNGVRSYGRVKCETEHKNRNNCEVTSENPTKPVIRSVLQTVGSSCRFNAREAAPRGDRSPQYFRRLAFMIDVAWKVEVFTGQIFSPNSSPSHEAGSKSIPPQMQNLMGQPPQSISKSELFLPVSN